MPCLGPHRYKLMVPFSTVSISMVTGGLSGSSGETGSEIRGVLEQAVLMQLASGGGKKKKKAKLQICSSPAGGSLVISLLTDLLPDVFSPFTSVPYSCLRLLVTSPRSGFGSHPLRFSAGLQVSLPLPFARHGED